MSFRQATKDTKGAKVFLEPGEELDRLASAAIGAALEVHREIGPGFRESLYEQALCVELTLRGISFERQCTFPLEYKGRLIGECVLDLLVAGRLVVELKVVEALAPIHTAQVVSYLRASGCQLGLLFNFNVSTLKQGIRRVVLTK